MKNFPEKNSVIFTSSYPMTSSIFDNAKIDEYFFNEDYGGLEVNKIRCLLYQKPDFAIFEENNNFVITKIVSFNILKEHFSINNNKPIIYFNQLNESTNIFFNSIINIINYLNPKNCDNNNLIKTFIETLIDDEKVVGYRFWFFLFSTNPQSDDKQDAIYQKNMDDRQKDLFNKKNKMDIVLKEPKIKKKNELAKIKEELNIKKSIYKYILLSNDNINIFTIIKNYLYNDSNLIKKKGSLSKLILTNNNNNNFLINEDKKFYDKLLEETEKNNKDSILFLSLLSKESSMIYFTSNVNKTQKDLSNYFNYNNQNAVDIINEVNNLLNDLNNNNQQEDVEVLSANLDKKEILNNLRARKLGNNFKQFPFKNIVYEISTEWLLPDVFYSLPLPHSLDFNLLSKSIINKSKLFFKREFDNYFNNDDNIFKPIKSYDFIGLHNSIYIPTLTEFYSIQKTNDKTLNENIEESKLTGCRLLYSFNYTINNSNLIDNIENNIRNILINYINENKNTFNYLSNFKFFIPQTRTAKIQYCNTLIFNKLATIINDKINQLKPIANNNNNSMSLEEEEDNFIEDFVDDDDEDFDKIDDDDDMNIDEDSEDSEASDQDDNSAQNFYDYCQDKPPFSPTNFLEQELWFKDILDIYTPNDIDINNINTLLKYATNIQSAFLKFDIFLRLNIINKMRFNCLRNLYPFRDVKKNIKKGIEEHPHYKEYKKKYNQLQDAIAAECFYYFFTSDKKVLSNAYIGIRDWIIYNANDFFLPTNQFNIDLRPYGQFRTWLLDFFNSVAKIENNQKICTLLFFCKLHHCRYYHTSDFDESKKVKNNAIMTGEGIAGKSNLMELMKKTTPANDKCVLDLTHSTAGASNAQGNFDGQLKLMDEFASSIWNKDKKSNTVSTQGEQLKNQLTSQQTQTLALVMDKVTHEDGSVEFTRDQQIYNASLQISFISTTNAGLNNADQPFLTRNILISVPKKKDKKEKFGDTNINDHRFDPSINPKENNEKNIKFFQILHGTYVLLEILIKANAMDESNYGIEISGGERAMHAVLNLFTQKTGIDTSDTRKRTQQLEIERTMAGLFGCWVGHTSPFTQYLFNHNNQRIGINHRVFTMGIFPFCVITQDQIIDGGVLLNFNYNNPYIEEILHIFLHNLSTFFHKDNNDCFLQEIIEEYDENGRIKDKKRVTDYSYISYKCNGFSDLIRNIYSSMSTNKDAVISEEDIKTVLENLQKRYSKIYCYEKNTIIDKKFLYIKEGNDNLPLTENKPVANYKKIEKNKQSYAFSISISFLKEMLPNSITSKDIESEQSFFDRINQNKPQQQQQQDDSSSQDLMLNILQDLPKDVSPLFDKQNITQKQSSKDKQQQQQLNISQVNIIEDKRKSDLDRLDRTFILKDTDPFVWACRQYYENKYIGVGLFKNEEERQDFIQYYTNINKNNKFIPLRFITPDPPKDYELRINSKKLPTGISNRVKLKKVLSVIEFDINSKNEGYIHYNRINITPSESVTVRAASYIECVDGTWKEIGMDKKKMEKNTQIIEYQKRDHDYISCRKLLKRLNYPGLITLNFDIKLFNHPLKLYSYLYQEFIRDDKIIKLTQRDKLIYPESNIIHFIQTKKAYINAEIHKNRIENKQQQQQKQINSSQSLPKSNIIPNSLSLKNSLSSTIPLNQPPNRVLDFMKNHKREIQNQQKKQINIFLGKKKRKRDSKDVNNDNSKKQKTVQK